MIMLLSSLWITESAGQQVSDKSQTVTDKLWSGSFDFKSGLNYEKDESFQSSRPKAHGHFKNRLSRTSDPYYESRQPFRDCLDSLFL